MLKVASLSSHRFCAVFIGVAVCAALATGIAAQGCRRSAEAERQAPDSLSSAALTDQEGAARRFSDFEGKSVVLSFFFTSCPSVCPRETRALAEVQRRLSPALSSRVQFLSLTVDPDNDSNEKLKAFARDNGADPSNWAFVRASPPATTALTKELAVFADPQQAQAAPVGHGTSVYLFDGRGRLMQRYAGSPLDGARLARELEQLDWSRQQASERSSARL